MPVYLPPISRRQFLVRSLGATAALTLAPALLAGKKDVDPNYWALFADTHIAADRTLKSRNINMAEHFQKASAEMLASAQAPAGLLVCGDCAYNTGVAEDYAVLRELLVPIRQAGIPIHLALGNHDHRTRFWDAFPEAKAAARAPLERQASLVETPQANWLVLDSLDKTNSTPGQLGMEQLAWLAKTLDANPTKPALVFIHHNPGLTGNFGVIDTAALYEVIRPRKQVKAYIFGHTHHWETTQDSSGIHLVNLPPVAYVFKDGEPSGWVRANLGTDHMRLELRCIDEKHPMHAKVVKLDWR